MVVSLIWRLKGMLTELEIVMLNQLVYPSSIMLLMGCLEALPEFKYLKLFSDTILVQISS